MIASSSTPGALLSSLNESPPALHFLAALASPAFCSVVCLGATQRTFTTAMLARPSVLY